ncbi:unnamed protein product [Meloidogyne enterolobii]|uniref:Uncharacterized protein n=1 Tax=Meloidogyne enterolobii TaxID=390850 RepID=A0ACB0XSA4_MELEN
MDNVLTLIELLKSFFVAIVFFSVVLAFFGVGVLFDDADVFVVDLLLLASAASFFFLCSLIKARTCSISSAVIEAKEINIKNIDVTQTFNG